MAHNKIDEDTEARNAIWASIKDCASKLTGRCAIYVTQTPNSDARIYPQMLTPDVMAWQLVEALSLLTILLKADSVNTAEICNIFGQSGPIHFIEDGQDRYLWAQYSIRGQDSDLLGRPDLIVSTSPTLPSSQTVVRIIECKCRQRIGAPDIRGEFGKAHDLRVTSYLIWSFSTPPMKVIEGAKRLGIDVVPLGFDTERRGDLISNPENLVMHIAKTQEVCKRENRFAQTLLESSKEVSLKVTELPTRRST
jgi:hypothetical protein